MASRAYRCFDTTNPVVTACGRCRQPLIHGLAEGIHARTDPAPLTGPEAEHDAIRNGRLTYTLTRTGLVYRDPTRRTDPTLTGPVLADHNCPRRNP